MVLLLIIKSCIVIGNANSIKCPLQETRIFPKDRTGAAYTQKEFYDFAQANDPANIPRANTLAQKMWQEAKPPPQPPAAASINSTSQQQSKDRPSSWTPPLVESIHCQ